MDNKARPFIVQFGGGLLHMHADTKTYPPVCVGWGLTCPLHGNPEDQCVGAIDVHPGQPVHLTGQPCVASVKRLIP